MYGREDMLVIALTLDVGSVRSSVVEVFRQKGPVLPFCCLFTKAVIN